MRMRMRSREPRNPHHVASRGPSAKRGRGLGGFAARATTFPRGLHNKCYSLPKSPLPWGAQNGPPVG
jgi:hypothetical protein